MGKADSIALRESLKKSLNDSLQPTPTHITRRSEAKGIYHAIEPDKEQKLVLYNHIHSVGADQHVLGSNTKRNRQVLHKWFNTLVVNNGRFPSDLPVDFVLQEFFEAILQQKVPLKGFNLNAHMQAFHQWIDRFETVLRKRHWTSQNPDIRPKELTANASISEEEQKISDGQRAKNLRKMYGNNPPESIRKMIEKLEGKGSSRI